MGMKFQYAPMIFLIMAQTAAAQVVIMRDGSLPPPSVPPARYPAMVACTIEKRRADIEALLATRDKVVADAVKALEVVTSDGRRVKESKLLVEIVETCHDLKVGYPLGFWPDQLRGDWDARLANSRR
jgi:hypothetical protein